MQPAEVRDGGALLATTLTEVAELARDMHKAVAARVFGLLGPAAMPAKTAHDAIATSAYAASRLGVRVVPAVAGALAAELKRPSSTALTDSPGAHHAVSALNGFWGDRIAEQRQSLAVPLSVRTHNGVRRTVARNVIHDIANHGLTNHGLTNDDIGQPTGKIVIFLHGLCENERFWWFGAEKTWGNPNDTFGSRLYFDSGWTPLYVHYNSGLHISENGRRTADYLEQLVEKWPTAVSEIALVGHSMGGLVARSAAHQAHERECRWVASLRHIVGLGTPHLGAPLERQVNSGTHLMARLPETRPLAIWLNRRSVGIKDLRHGALLETDWTGRDADDRNDGCGPATLLPGVAYSMVAATLSAEPHGPFAHDLLVEHVSAHGTGRANATRRIEFEVDRLFHVGRRTHFHLLNDARVYARLRSWLDGADGAAPTF